MKQLPRVIFGEKDYGSFGSVLVGRTSEDENEYRYGFNGKEKDSETYGEGNIYDYGFRIYNPRLGKFLSVDPLHNSYPWYTPYQFAGNKPIAFIDLDGLEELLVIRWFGADGRYVESTYLRVANPEQRDPGHDKGGDAQVIELNISQNGSFAGVDGNDISTIESLVKSGGRFNGTYYSVMDGQQNRYNGKILEANDKTFGDVDNQPETPHFVKTTVFFEYDQTKENLVGLSQSELDKIKNALELDPERKLSILGYTSQDGDEEYNMTLSQERADKVKKFLIDNGIDESRILEATGLGETDEFEPGVSNSDKCKVAKISFTYERKAD